MKSHLIIGAGNMGRRYAGILMALGQRARVVDIGFDPKLAAKATSILLCTPPNTHADLISMFGHTNPTVPLFCEKPVMTETDSIIGPLPRVSMVGHNWRYCTCYSGLRDISCGYNANGGGTLDLIHFLDLFWERYGEPGHSTLFVAPGYVSLHAQKRGRCLDAEIWTEASPFCEIGGKLIVHDCDMFVKQMKVWLEVVIGKPSPNPISKALERTAYLISLIQTIPSPGTSFPTS